MNTDDEARAAMSEKIGEYYVRIEDMVWPSTTRQVRELEWQLRYAPNEAEKHRFIIASIVEAYCQMVDDTQAKRNMVCREIKRLSQP